MRRLLEIFPQCVMINSNKFKDQKKEYYSNKEFNINIANIGEKLEELNDIKVSIISDNHSMKDSDTEMKSLTDFLREREKSIRETEILEDNIQIILPETELLRENIVNCRGSKNNIYSVKSLKVNWEDNPNSYMHVFIDLTNMFNLEEANKSIHNQKIMFASASHEFRTPLNAILNSFSLIDMLINTKDDKNAPLKMSASNSKFSTSLMQNMAGLSPSCIDNIKKYTKMGSCSATLLLSLIEDILDMSKIEAGTFKINYDWFSLKKLLAEVVDVFNMQCSQKNIDLKLDIDLDLFEKHLYSDRGRIKQILLNLISNSLKFTFEGEISISVKPIICKSGKEIVEIEVADTGIGIKDNDQKNLFKVFGMASSSQKINPNGSGIGLTICQKYVEILGGQISLESQFGEGTSVKFTIENNIKEKLQETNGFLGTR